MRIQVSATRMELLRLRRRLVVARRGHKLLKDKQEQLMRKIMELITTIKGERQRLAKNLQLIQQQLRYAEASYGPENYLNALAVSGRTMKLDVGIRNIVNINVPTIKDIEFSGSLLNYDFTTTSGEIDSALFSLDELLPALLNLAINEKTLELLAEELERTRRRVNALEYVLIPSITETIKYITMKLTENERSGLVRLMRLKEIIRGK
jgi:V/A-type H+-transporting ATPase subunit D